MGLSRINVLLAAWIPGVSDVDEGAQTPKALALSRRLSEELRLLGRSLQVTEEGLIARMDLDPDDVECFAREPRSTAALMSTFAQLSRHAARLGAV